jgi:hypothetical protein
MELTMLAGGIADKVGNRYEALWLVDQLPDLIDGQALSVTNERFGDENDGFEFDVERTGYSEWFQSKRQTSRSWTIGAVFRVRPIDCRLTALRVSPATSLFI